MHCDLFQSIKLAMRTIFKSGLLQLSILFFCSGIGGEVFAEDFSNRIRSIQEKGGSGLEIVAESEIGSRYTSYLLSKPPRIVLDFLGADISSLPVETKLSGHSIRDIRVSTYEAGAVKSGRVELILENRIPYQLQVNGNILLVKFTASENVPSQQEKPGISQSAMTSTAESSVVPSVKSENVVEKPVAEKLQAIEGAEISSAIKKVSTATSILEIISRKDEIFLRADGELDQCKSFSLQSPARFVVDCSGVTEKIVPKSLKLSGPVKAIRIGNYPDKVRFVLEGEVKTIGKLATIPTNDGLLLRYDGRIPASAVSPVSVTPSVSVAPPLKVSTSERMEKNKKVPLTVEKVDFKVEDDKSLVIVSLSAPGELMQPIKDKTLLRFGIKGATITPSLRRTIDASSFPSVIRQITPYAVSTRGQFDVRFAVELKGDAPYELKSDGKIITLVVDNSKFSAIQKLEEKIELPVRAENVPQKNTAVADAGAQLTPPAKSSSEIISNETIKVAADKKYTGQLVSLNFDNIEIRNVLLLIAEVSNTNIIANDDVKGVITLRLNNVPWDQALDVIMESKGLGMEMDGNVLRIAPKEVMLKRKLDNAKIETEIIAISVKETKAFSVNYGPVDDIATKIKDQINDEGTVSSDARTRQIFVTTTPEKLKEIEEQIIKPLDVPDQQVTIEARIVEANSNFTRDLGVSWGISQQGTSNGPWDLNGAMITGGGSFTINPGTQATSTTKPVFNTAAGIGSQFSFGRIGIDSTILDLRLSALEASGYGKIVSTPRITTSNGEPAEISQGTQIPYQSTSDKGTETKFIDATLSLKVKPVINPDKSMILEIEVSNDSVGSTVATGIGSAPSINTKKAKTKVLVKSGETTVIGGIFIETETESEAGIPLLRSIPIIGHFFKSTKKSKDKTELMIFITPRIVE